MITSDRKHLLLNPDTDTPHSDRYNDMIESVNDIVPVANTTERATVAAAVSPTTSRPLVVARADAPANEMLEYTTDGTTWYPIRTAGPHFAATLASTSSVPSASWSTISLGTELVDTGGEHDPAAAFPTSAYLTAAVAGYRLITATAAFFPNGTGARGVRLRHTPNGGSTASVPFSATLVQATGGTVATVVSTPMKRVYMGVGDRVFMEAYQNSGAALDALGGTGDQVCGMQVTYDGAV